MPRKQHVAVSIAFVTGLTTGALGWLGVQHFAACRSFSYINPDLACGKERGIKKTGYVSLSSAIRHVVARKKMSGEASAVSVYFRDLCNGPMMAIDEDLVFTPASLLKLPIVLAFFDFERERPGTLAVELTYSPDNVPRALDFDQIEMAATGLRIGERYSIEKLLQAAITQSDNLAYFLALGYANTQIPGGADRLQRTLRELGIIDPSNDAEEVVTAHGYASIFRILHNVAFLDAEDSEKVLSWLAASAFDKGLAAGVPANVPIANKFGERSLADGTKQLHDCGIVYFPGNPYSLCIMTKGREWEPLRQVIATISRMVYEEVLSRR